MGAHKGEGDKERRYKERRQEGEDVQGSCNRRKCARGVTEGRECVFRGEKHSICEMRIVWVHIGLYIRVW